MLLEALNETLAYWRRRNPALAAAAWAVAAPFLVPRPNASSPAATTVADGIGSGGSGARGKTMRVLWVSRGTPHRTVSNEQDVLVGAKASE